MCGSRKLCLKKIKISLPLRKTIDLFHLHFHFFNQLYIENNSHHTYIYLKIILSKPYNDVESGTGSNTRPIITGPCPGRRRARHRFIRSSLLASYLSIGGCMLDNRNDGTNPQTSLPFAPSGNRWQARSMG